MDWPTNRGKSQEMPYSAIRPRRAKAVVILAPEAAKRTSQQRAWTSETPAHPPLIAQMIGFGIDKA